MVGQRSLTTNKVISLFITKRYYFLVAVFLNLVVCLEAFAGTSQEKYKYLDTVVGNRGRYRIEIIVRDKAAQAEVVDLHTGARTRIDQHANQAMNTELKLPHGATVVRAEFSPGDEMVLLEFGFEAAMGLTISDILRLGNRAILRWYSVAREGGEIVHAFGAIRPPKRWWDDAAVRAVTNHSSTVFFLYGHLLEKHVRAIRRIPGAQVVLGLLVL